MVRGIPPFLQVAERLRRALWVSPPRNEQEKTMLRDQCNLLFLLCLLFPAAGLPNLVLNSFAFGLGGDGLTIAVTILVAILYAVIAAEALLWKRHHNDFRFLRHTYFLYIALGFAWGTVIILFAGDGRPDQTALLLGLAAAIVSTPIISVPFAIAFGFFIPDAILSIYAIVFVMPEGNFFSATAFVSFTLYAAVGITFNNIHFGGRSEARAALQREIETVNIFLREYEEASTDWLWQTDRYGRLEKVAPRFSEVTGLAPAAINGRPLVELVQVVRENSREEEPSPVELPVFFAKRRAFRDLLVHYDGEDGGRFFRLTGHPVFGENGYFDGFRGIGCDVTSDQQAREKVSFLAAHDSLTGLVNRRVFLQGIEKLCHAKQPFALLLIDVDNFKSINDTHGHHVGDLLLQAMASRIRHSMRPSDMAARLGGDEFAVLILGADGKEGLLAAERIATDFRNGFKVEGIFIPTGASVGVGAYPEDAIDPDRLRVVADLALYKAKEGGKGQARLFSPWIEEERYQLVGQENELRRALEKGEIGVVYQPIVDIDSGYVVASEALVRWNHPSRGLILPGKFIAIAERSELMEGLGELVLRLACRDAAGWPEPIQVNVNLSPRQLRSGRFPQILREALEESSLPAERLAIEITESVLLEQNAEITAQLAVIRKLGVKLILDDFGTGYSSLTYLHNVEVSGLKVDATFTQKLSQQKVQVIYRTIARLAMDLNIYVVAEGVEEPGQLEWLDRNGIRFAQGYLLGRPASSPPVRRAQYLT